MNFWQKLQKPVFILAPMEEVTDSVFRQIVAGVACPQSQQNGLHGGRGKPDVFFTEFVPVDALLSEGRERALRALKYTKIEKPIVAQIWGSDPEKFYRVAKMLSGMKFDGIDINMGCPDKNAVKKGACAALIKNPMLASEIIKATIKGANGLPVSVKTRIGFGKIDIENWVGFLLRAPIAALVLHLRTVPEMSKVPAHWEEIGKAVEIRNRLKSKTLIIGNGDVKTLKEARDKCEKYGLDGIMIGRGIFENIYLFNEEIDISKVTPKQKIGLLLKHLVLFKRTWSGEKHFAQMKKFVKCYVNNFDGAFACREKLMRTKTLDELIQETKHVYSEL